MLNVWYNSVMKKRALISNCLLCVTLAVLVFFAPLPAILPQAEAAAGSELRVFDSGLFDETPFCGTDAGFFLPAGAKSLLDPDRIKPFFSPSHPIGYQEEIFTVYDTSQKKRTVQLAAVSTHCQVWISISDDLYSYFSPSGTTPNSKAAAIAAEFENIYSLATGAIGEPVYIPGSSKKINIILFDINNDNEPGSAYIAGYFYSADYLDYPDSNEDTIIYIDIGEEQGFKKFNSEEGAQEWTSFFGIITHEFQHLINFSHFVNNINNGSLEYPTDGTDPDCIGVIDGVGYATNVSTWYDEGLSGLIEVMYQKTQGYTMDEYYLDDFLNGNVGASGFIPTKDQWVSTPMGLRFSLYGASSAMMQEYYALTNDASYLAANPRTGYPNSLKNVAYGYGKADSIAGFNEFFTIANLNIQVDSPSAPAAPYVFYTSDVAGNTWAYKTANDITDPLISANSEATFNTGGRTYFTKTYLSSNTFYQSSGYINITVPTAGEYYIITPYNMTNVINRTGAGGWDVAPKIALKLAPGLNTGVSVGKNNMFAILAIAHDVPVNGNILYTAAVGKQGDVNGDNKVDATDLSMLISDFGKTGTFSNPGSDVNGDNKVDATDLSMLISNFGK